MSQVTLYLDEETAARMKQAARGEGLSQSQIAKSGSTKKRRSQLDSMLRVVHLLPFDPAAAEASARIRADLEVKGMPIGPVDTLIAGTASAAGATLVSHNKKEFGRVQGLRVVDRY
jgi:tRNA(fMet)-specific endonuclease VapC